MVYTEEYQLTKKPLQIDVLIIKKTRKHQVKNEIGRIFRRHNIVEYKSSEDRLNINTFLKVLAYACLYKVSEKREDAIRMEEITITLIRERYPRKLFRWFGKMGYKVEERYAGIFYITGVNLFLIQVIVAKKLSPENQKWLTLMNRELNDADAKRAIIQTDQLEGKEEKDLADALMQVVVSENETVFNGAKKEADGMCCEALKKLMEPEFNEMKAAAIAEGLAQGMEQGLAQGMAQGMAQGRAEAEREFQKTIEAMNLEIEALKRQNLMLRDGCV